MSKSKLGSLNPMYGKEKSKEFIEHMNKDKKGNNNPMFGKIKSETTLSKLRKKIYVYDSNKNFVKCYESISFTVKDLHISNQTIKKYVDTNKPCPFGDKDRYFYSKLQ